MLTATKENTVEVTPAELRELANCLEKADQNSTGDALVWFNDKILFKYSKILLDTVPKIEGIMEFKKTRYGTICIDKDLPEPDTFVPELNFDNPWVKMANALAGIVSENACCTHHIDMCRGVLLREFLKEHPTRRISVRNSRMLSIMKQFGFEIEGRYVFGYLYKKDATLGQT